VLRLILGNDEESLKFNDERLIIIETNIDDMSPQIYGYVMDQAFERGALDCYFTNVQMKKNRPGVIVSILCRPSELDALCELLLTETTTLGVRHYEVQRRSLEREMTKVNTAFGSIDVKVARLNGRIVKSMPEYDQCRRAALDAGVALHLVEEAARAAFVKSQGDG
jgi:uncharacterized protein (DUF111 family)